MTVLRCTAKLLKRLKQPLKPPEPAAQTNPLGEWYADLDVCQRRPYVVMMNRATGVVLFLGGYAADMRALNESAFLQFASLCERLGLRGAGVDAELHGFDEGFAFAATRDRHLLGSMNERKFTARYALAGGESMDNMALREWMGLFHHPDVPGVKGRYDYRRPFDLARARLTVTTPRAV